MTTKQWILSLAVLIAPFTLFAAPPKLSAPSAIQAVPNATRFISPVFSGIKREGYLRIYHRELTAVQTPQEGFHLYDGGAISCDSFDPLFINVQTSTTSKSSGLWTSEGQVPSWGGYLNCDFKQDVAAFENIKKATGYQEAHDLCDEMNCHFIWTNAAPQQGDWDTAKVGNNLYWVGQFKTK